MAKSGGAIYVQSTLLTVSGSNFTNNSALTQGGAVYLNSQSQLGNSSITLTYFGYNSATASGGAIHYADSRPDLSNITNELN